MALRSSRSHVAAAGAASVRSVSSKSSYMSEKRRARLKDIQRRAMLQDALTQKLLKNYGNKFTNQDRAKRVIGEEVTKLIQQPAVPSHTDLEDLQTTVERRAVLSAASVARKARIREEELRVLRDTKGGGASRSSSSSRRPSGMPPLRPFGERGGATRSTLSRSGGRVLGSSRSGYITGRSTARTSRPGTGLRRMEPSRSTPALPPRRGAGGDARRHNDSLPPLGNQQFKFRSSAMYGAELDAKDLSMLPKRKKVPGPEDRRTLEWNMIDELENEAHEEREEKEKRILEENKKKVADYLAEQVKEKEEREKAEIEEHNNYFEELLASIKNEDEREALKKAEEARKEAAAKAEYDYHLRQAQERKRKAEEQERAADAAYARQAAALAKAAQEELEAKKQAHRETMLRVREENEAEEAKKAERREKEREEEVKLLEEAAAVAEKREAERQSKLKFHAKLNYKTDHILKMYEEERKRDEALLQQISDTEAKRKKEDDERAAAREAAAEARKAEMLRILAEQVAEKEKNKQKEQQAARADVDRLSQAIKQHEAEERAKKEALRKKNIAHRRELERQILASASRLDDPFFNMSDTERLLNRDKLQKALTSTGRRSHRQSYRMASARSGAASVLSTRPW